MNSEHGIRREGGIKSCKIVVLGNWDWDVYHAGHILGATD